MMGRGDKMEKEAATHRKYHTAASSALNITYMPIERENSGKLIKEYWLVVLLSS